MNKYMLALLLAAPGAVYAMEQGDTPAGVGSPGPNTNSQPGGSILAQVTQGSLNRGDDISAAEEAFLDKFGGLEKGIEEVRGDVTTLKGSVDELEKKFAALQKEEGNNNGAVSNDDNDDKLKEIKERVALATMWGRVIDMEDKELLDPPVRQRNNSIAYKFKDDRKKLIAATHILIFEYDEKHYKGGSDSIMRKAITSRQINASWSNPN